MTSIIQKKKVYQALFGFFFVLISRDTKPINKWKLHAQKVKSRTYCKNSGSQYRKYI